LLTINVPQRLQLTSLEIQAASAGFTHGTNLDETTATKSAVERNLLEAEVVHFAGHAYAEPRTPLDSALEIANCEKLTVADLIKLRPPQAKLAVLSGCETAWRGTELLDEAVSLPTGLLEAGFGAVIASMWAVSDTSTALTILRFYQNWREHGFEIADSLRKAQGWLRDATRAELVQFVIERRSAVGGPDKAWDIALGEIREMSGDNERPFQHAYWWAPFCCTG
jgi:CHAT domain-containing protein